MRTENRKPKPLIYPSGSASTLIVAVVSVLCIAAVVTISALNSPQVDRQKNGHQNPGDSQFHDGQPAGASQLPSVEHVQLADQPAGHAVFVNRPLGPPRADTGVVDPHGKPVTVACSTCHATRAANFDNKSTSDLNEFHQNMDFAHGTISCLSCHNHQDYDALKLADGTRVEFTDVMALCAQCHGPQMRDYQHGVHGGMNGHWDLRFGEQKKNNCIDCHNPHSPKFPKMQPTFKPKDRFLGH